jgi:WhiB family redox-sensing transcriptional regulator
VSLADILNWATAIPAWMENATCTSSDPDLWFSSNPFEIEAAKKSCRSCPVRDKCLEFALENNERYGVWGEKSPTQRERIKTKRRADVA